MDLAREERWQEAWARAGLAVAHRVPGREKFYALVAYPGASGFIHIGHLRGLLLADSLHRYHRMLGHQVFFPTGTHASGLPSVTFSQKVKNRETTTVQQLKDNEVPESEWPSLEDPANAARFLGAGYLSVFRRMGLLVDQRAYVTTIDDDYQAFIRWQFQRLHDHGALVQGPHFAAFCPVCGPVSVDPSETDLSSGGEAERIRYTTVPFSLSDGRILLAATLRPETVFGVTNLWLPVTGELTVWHHHETSYVVSRTAAERLVEQHGGSLGHEVDRKELLGLSARTPITGVEVPLFQSRLVDPSVGTGIVMSVPAHAPADWLALKELNAVERGRLRSIPVIIEVSPEPQLSPSDRELLTGNGPPAERANRVARARTLSDTDELTGATERLYRFEFARGRMSSGPLQGRSVPEARESVAADLRNGGSSFELLEFSEPVICRNGHQVGIRLVPDQWFLHYSDTRWKERAHDLVQAMTIRPDDYARELPGVIDWFQDRPCTRRGRWLGTPFPFDPTWIIEPIADSTFYPAYFVVRPFVADGRLSPASLTEALFDYVFLGRGSGEPTVDRALQEEIREEFLYWFPVDLNIGGKEHKRVHFPVFLFTNALLLPTELQPRGLVVHWWLTDRGGAKISKKQVSSKGGAIPPIRDALQRWGADALRLFYATAASPYQDIEWDPTLVDAAMERLSDIERIALQLRGTGGGVPELDEWLESEVHDVVRRVRVAFQEASIRDAAELIYATLPSLLRRYVLRGGAPGPASERVLSVWTRLLSPITPHLAEELGERRFPSLVASERFPSEEELVWSEKARAEEQFLEAVEEDLRNVLRPATLHGEIPSAVVFFVAEPWKRTIETWLREGDSAKSGPPPVRAVMDRAKQHPELAAYRSQIPKYVERIALQVRREPPPPEVTIDERSVLRRAEGYLSRRYQFGRVSVFSEEEGSDQDPLGRRERARPGRPAFYLINARRGLENTDPSRPQGAPSG